MTSPAAGTPESRHFTRRDSISAWFQYAGLWALVFAWPAYQNIASGPEALTGVGARRLDLLAVVVLVSLVGPTALFLIEVLIRRLGSRRPAEIFRAIVIGVLIAGLIWQQLVETGMPGIPRHLIPLLVAGVIAVAYLRSALVRNFSEILGVAAPVVIVAFFLRYPIQAEVLPHESGSDYATIEADTPVVIVIFDELPLASLERRPRQIDGRLFPRFSALARTSDWYPDMTAVSDQTTTAVPAILTGRTPDDQPAAEPTPPGLPDYPDSVCSLARKGGYEVFAYEPITDLCSRTYGFGTRVATLVNRGTASSDFKPERRAGQILTNRFPKPWPEYTEQRVDAVDSFVEGMPGKPRSISVLHIALPHVLWQFLPDGTLFNPETFPNGDDLVPGRGTANVFLQQHLLQLAFTDSELGRIIDRMKADGIWNESLMVVTADHGASFKPGTSRRILTDENLGWNLPVPLFIKYPGQTRGEVVPGKVDSRDITPTILDVLGGKPAPSAAGKSLAGGNLEPAKGQVTAKGYTGEIEIDRDELDRQFAEARKQRNALFAGGRLYALGGHRDLLGRKPSSVERLKPIASTLLDPTLFQNVVLESGFVPAYVRAKLMPDPGVTPNDLAVSVNGRIAATATAGQLYSTWLTSVTVPASSFINGANRVEFFRITGRASLRNYPETP